MSVLSSGDQCPVSCQVSVQAHNLEEGTQRGKDERKGATSTRSGKMENGTKSCRLGTWTIRSAFCAFTSFAPAEPLRYRHRPGKRQSDYRGIYCSDGQFKCTLESPWRAYVCMAAGPGRRALLFLQHGADLAGHVAMIAVIFREYDAPRGQRIPTLGSRAAVFPHFRDMAAAPCPAISHAARTPHVARTRGNRRCVIIDTHPGPCMLILPSPPFAGTHAARFPHRAPLHFTAPATFHDHEVHVERR